MADAKAEQSEKLANRVQDKANTKLVKTSHKQRIDNAERTALVWETAEHKQNIINHKTPLRAQAKRCKTQAPSMQNTRTTQENTNKTTQATTTMSEKA